MEVPGFEYAPEYNVGEDLKALFYDALPYKGKATKVFAYIGIPERHEGQKVPAVVLVHGGAGTAYADWVRKWNARGYAAIAMDLEGHIPQWDEQLKTYKPHESGGPANQAVWKDIGEPIEEQWTYHAVADVVRAHSLLRTLPEVNPDKIGIVGISWGGILTGIVCGIDERFKFAIPVYGSGFVYESESYFGDAYRSWSPDLQTAFIQLWEPSTYLRKAKLPMLWVNGDNDGHFPLTVFTKSYRIVKEHAVLSIHPGMSHNQETAVQPPEIYAFADSVVGKGQPLARITRHEEWQGQASRKVAVQVESAAPIVKVEMYYTLNIADRLRPVWNKAILELPEKGTEDHKLSGQANGQTSEQAGDASGHLYKLPLETDLPDKAKAYYINFIDERGYIVSTELTDMPLP
ncbi:alpha/beta hydrolase family protein [Paenibacillus sp. GCM10027626]|uniref:alpha/beta hydrolase family protein n=1 Tax=Paenibacillus sp. GCM10027626 TaxID=3273411 RepID=UPI00362574E4